MATHTICMLIIPLIKSAIIRSSLSFQHTVTSPFLIQHNRCVPPLQPSTRPFVSLPLQMGLLNTPSLRLLKSFDPIQKMDQVSHTSYGQDDRSRVDSHLKKNVMPSRWRIRGGESNQEWTVGQHSSQGPRFPHWNSMQWNSIKKIGRASAK